VSFADGPPQAAFKEICQGSPVVVWKDTEGRKRFLAPPEQRPFFRVVGYDQLRAQLESC
jgi:hypothetical protein